MPFDTKIITKLRANTSSVIYTQAIFKWNHCAWIQGYKGQAYNLLGRSFNTVFIGKIELKASSPGAKYFSDNSVAPLCQKIIFGLERGYIYSEKINVVAC